MKTLDSDPQVAPRSQRAFAFGFAIALGATLICNTNEALIRPAARRRSRSRSSPPPRISPRSLARSAATACG